MIFKRRHVQLLLALCAVLMLVPAAPASAERTVKRHDKGATVKKMQRLLGIKADGLFGKGTARAVKRFQRSRGRTADGIVGPATWAALGHPSIDTVLKRRGGSRAGGLPVRVRRIIRAANRIADKPYKYGGGHGSFEDSGYDCSGAASYALHGAGALDAPLDSSGLMSFGEAGPGASGARGGCA